MNRHSIVRTVMAKAAGRPPFMFTQPLPAHACHRPDMNKGIVVDRTSTHFLLSTCMDVQVTREPVGGRNADDR